MERENAINFLLYSYFEVTLEDRPDTLIDRSIARAYRDASSRVLSIVDEQEKETCNEDATECLRDSIKALESDLDYNSWFKDTCCELKSKYNNAENAEGDSAFQFGHAQKWVNMTMKYLCVIKSIFRAYGKEVFSWLTPDLEQKLHIPVDSYVMEAAASEGKLSDRPNICGLGIRLPNKQGELGKYGAAKAWSKWDCDDYTKFTEQLDGKFAGINPLDWEGPAWIEIAKKRKEKEKNRKQKSLQE